MQKYILSKTILISFSLFATTFGCATRKFSAAKTAQLPNFKCSAGNSSKAILKLQKLTPEEDSKSAAANIVKSKTRILDNGNTFIQFQETLEGCNAEIAIPANLTADELMELLIKTRTAKSVGAVNIAASFETPIQETKVTSEKGENIRLSLEDLFYASGAQQIVENGKTRKIKKNNIQQKPLDSASKPMYSAATYPDYASKLAKELCLTQLTQEAKETNGSKETTLKSGKVLVVMSQAVPVNENFFLALAESEKLTQKGFTIHMHMPYLPYARSDKIDQEGVTVTGRLIADLVESSGAKEVSFVRAHAPQSQGFFGVKSIQISGRETVNAYLKEKNVGVVVSPDAGFQKDATLYADELGVPVAVANKQRSPDGTARLVGFSGTEYLNGKVAAIIDDETASGGTLVSNAKVLKTFGASSILAVVTHVSGAASAVVKDFSSLDGSLSEMVATNTIPFVAQPGMKVLSVVEEVARRISATMNAGCNK